MDQQSLTEIDSWRAVTSAISDLAVPLGRSRGVEIEAATGDGPIDKSRRFSILARDRGVFLMRLMRERNAVECHWEQENGNAWWCQYRIEPDGTWVGPLARGADNLRLATTDEIARNIIDGWLIAVVPHH
jgi:hypothetical protein